MGGRQAEVHEWGSRESDGLTVRHTPPFPQRARECVCNPPHARGSGNDTVPQAGEKITLAGSLERETEEKQFATCYTTIKGVKKRRYCMRACQSKANYQRHAERYRKAHMDTHHQQKVRGEKEYLRHILHE